MGPIATKLRDRAELYSPPVNLRVWAGMSPDVFDVCLYAAQSLGLEDPFLHSSDVDGDVLTEAIEAAEALGL